MFAIIQDGGRQYRVAEGDVVRLDYRGGSEPGGTITFGEVLLANGGGASTIGKPLIDGASVIGEVVTPQIKGKKLEIVKFRRRKNWRRHTGHRQKYTAIKITKLDIPGLES